MRLNLRLWDPASGREDHVVVNAEPEATVGEVVRGLQDIQPGELSVRSRPLRGDDPLSQGALRDGDVVSVGVADSAALDRTGARPAIGLELAVVGGPEAGRVWPLPTGTWTVGRAEDSDFRLDHPTVSPRHVRLIVEDNLAAVEDLGSRNGTAVDGRPAAGPTLARPGWLVQVGAALLEIRPVPAADADTSADGEGGLAFNRPARIRQGVPEVHIILPAAPKEQDKYPFPWVPAVAPVLLAGVGAVIFHRPEVMLFALMSPVLTVSNALSSRRMGARRSKREGEGYVGDLATARSRMTDAVRAETARVRHEFPDPAALGAFATGPGRRLWERRAADGDALVLRVGTVNRRAAMSLTTRGGDAPPPVPEVPSAPVLIDLARAGVLGIAGPVPAYRSLARWLVGQLAVLRSPKELDLVVLTPADSAADWEWIRFLPHVRLSDPAAPVAMIGNDQATREERVKELLKLLDLRQAASRESSGPLVTSTVVVVFDGVRELRSLPGVPRLLREGPAVGILAIGLDTDATRLAEEGRAEVLLDPDEPALGLLRVDGADPVPGVLVDGVSPAWADEVARGLAPIRDVGSEGESVIPDAVRFADLAGIDLDNPDEIVGRWTLGGRTTSALVGASIDGQFSLDLKRDGPHALVAGTTGSGKSEFLQTLVVALATVNKPDAMNFVLIDYKGASAFADCERLPHTVGMVTNLDSHLTERALASLDAELERREHVLKDLGAPDVDAAWSKASDEAGARGLARLVIVIDEFAELVTELPDFVSGLIRIARVGRSLGVHLILATQRPAGVVSAEMRANTGLRVAFRMEDKNDSTEVLESAEAATISRSTPGRGYVRRGGGAMVVQFQTARVAGRRRGATEAVPPPRVQLAPWKSLGYPPPAPPRAAAAEATATDLFALVDLTRRAAEKMGLAAPRRPWLAPLPDRIELDVLTATAAGDQPARVAYGLEDLPARQAQQPACFDLVGGGHLAIAGAPRSGRSTVLRTLAAALARSISPSDLHVYGLDFGNGALLPLTALPHCGAVVSRSETDRVERLLARLGDEMSRRQAVLAAQGFGDIAEQRAGSPSADRLPYIVVFLDRWEGLLSQFPLDSGSEVPGTVVRLVREGLGVGIRFVLAGDRSLLNDRVTTLIDDKLVLRLSDRNDYRLVNVNPRSISEEMPPGRAVRGDSGGEVQLALLGPDASGQAQSEAVRAIGREAGDRWPAGERSNCPFRVDVLPTTIGYDAAAALAGGQAPGGMWALVGVAGDELGAVGVDLTAGGGFIVGGPARSGRSTTLAVMARSLQTGGGVELVVVCPRPSPLQELDGKSGVLAVLSGAPTPDDLTMVLRKASEPVVVLVDDAEVFGRTEADATLREFIRGALPGTVAVVMAGSTDDLKNSLKGAIVEVRKAKAGLLLSAESTLDGELIGVRLPRNLIGRTPPGRGILGLNGEPIVTQVPMP